MKYTEWIKEQRDGDEIECTTTCADCVEEFLSLKDGEKERLEVEEVYTHTKGQYHQFTVSKIMLDGECMGFITQDSVETTLRGEDDMLGYLANSDIEHVLKAMRACGLESYIKIPAAWSYEDVVSNTENNEPSDALLAYIADKNPELSEYNPDLQSLTPSMDSFTGKMSSGDPLGYYVYPDKSLWFWNNAYDEVWCDGEDFILESLKGGVSEFTQAEVDLCEHYGYKVEDGELVLE